MKKYDNLIIVFIANQGDNDDFIYYSWMVSAIKNCGIDNVNPKSITQIDNDENTVYALDNLLKYANSDCKVILVPGMYFLPNGWLKNLLDKFDSLDKSVRGIFGIKHQLINAPIVTNAFPLMETKMNDFSIPEGGVLELSLIHI